MRRALTLGTLLLIGGMTMVVAAQQPAARATLPDLQKVKDNLYIIAASSPVDRSQFTGGNTGVFVMDTGVWSWTPSSPATVPTSSRRFAR